MNLPNLLTLSRFLLACLFVIFAHHGPAGSRAALLVFTIAVLTDFLDGYIARRFRLVTDFGKLMDPVADKVLTLTAFFILAFEGLVPLWMVIVIALREILVTASRLHALTRGQVIPAEQTGKIKTVAQMTTIFTALAYRVWGGSPDLPPALASFQYSWQGMIFLLMIFSVVLTIWSGIEYVFNLPREADR